MPHEPSATRLFEPLAAIERALRGALDATESTPGLHAAMEYAALGGGKRLRPVLAWRCCVACGAGGDASLPAGVAVELIHCFSLVHDDLPALDDDDLRRGKPSLHKHAGEAMAILAGDALLNLAYETLTRAAWTGVGEPGTTTLRMALVRELASAASRMIAGQVFDTLQDFPPDLTTDLARLEHTHSRKTGALLEASCVMGAMCARPTETERIDAVRAYGSAIGLMFQAVDDLLDVTQTIQHTGKRTHKDAQAGKLTYPAVCGVEGTRAQIESLLQRAVDASNRIDPNATQLSDMANFLARRTK